MINQRTDQLSLPKGWVCTKLAEIAEVNPKSLNGNYIDDTQVTFLPMNCVEEISGNLDLSLTRKLSEVKRGYTPFVEDDLLFAKITPCMENGKVAIARGLSNGIGFGSTEFHVIRLPQYLPRKFMFFFLIQEELRKDAKRSMAGTAGQLRVPPSYMRQIPIPFPPLLEQHRIVAKIEELFTGLDAAVEALKKVRVQLKAYRQAVLKYTFQGKLTVEWREAHKGEMEPASALLARIKEERRKNGEAKFKQLAPVDTADLPQLPEGWVWTRVGELYDIVGGGTPSTKVAEYWNGDIPWITSADIHGLKDIRPRRQITRDAISQSATNLVPKGSLIVVTRVGLGKIALTECPMCFSQDSQALIGDTSLIYPDYSLYCLSRAVQIFKYKHRGTTIAGVTKKQLSELEYALPPLHEQQKIVEEIERHFSVADEMENTVERGLKQAVRLRQSILKSAFEGKLVPQDPSDEPAEKLLERIKAEKASRELETRESRESRGKTRALQSRLI